MLINLHIEDPGLDFIINGLHPHHYS